MNKLLSLALLSLGFTSCLVATAELETVVVQLRSRQDTHGDLFLQEMQTITAQYLNDYFGAYFSNSKNKEQYRQSEVMLNSFGVQGFHKSFISTVEVDPVLSFGGEAAPSEDFLNQLLTNAFSPVNIELYMENLVKSEDDFLSSVTHVVVEINDIPITEKVLDSATGEEMMADPEEEGLVLSKWGEIAIYVVVGIVGLILLVTFYLSVKCCCCRSEKVEDEPEPLKLRTIEIPHNFDQPQKPRRTLSRPRGFKTNLSNTFLQSGTVLEGRERSPSPVRSLASQDSSLFTYNPKGTNLSRATFSVGSLSNVNLDMQSVDLEAWTRSNTISSVQPAPFGHDISAIQNRDLSLIEEEEEEGAPVARSRTRPIPSGLELRGHCSSWKSSSHTRGTRNKEQAKGGGSPTDVISDLRNLSLQIDKHRRGKTGQ